MVPVTVSASKVRHAVARRREVGMRSISRQLCSPARRAVWSAGCTRRASGRFSDDASRLNPVPVAGHAIISRRDDDRVVASCVPVAGGRACGQPLCVGVRATRWADQSLPRGAALRFRSRRRCASPNTAKRQYRVRGGVRWSEVIQALDPPGSRVASCSRTRLQRCRHLERQGATADPVPFGPFARPCAPCA